MTTISTSDDLLELLRNNHKFREAVKQALFTEELLALPSVFNAFAAEVRSDIKQLKDGQERLENGYKRLEDGQKSHTNDIGELKGIGLETKLYNRGPALIATLLKTRGNARVRVAEQDANSESFNAEIYKAQDAGLITDDEYERILDTDIIIKSFKPDVSKVLYTAIESSYSVTRADIQKVKETASVLSNVFPEAEIHSALYYMNIASFIQEDANRQGVHLIKAKNLT